MNHLPTIHFLLVSGRVLSTFHILSQIPTQLAVSSCIKPVGFPCFFPTKAIGNIWMFPKIVVPLSYQLSYPFVFHYKPIHFGIYIYTPIFETTPNIFHITKPQLWCGMFWRCSKSFWRPPGSPGPFRASLPFAARRHGVNNPATDPLRSPSPYRSIHELVDLFCSL